MSNLEQKQAARTGVEQMQDDAKQETNAEKHDSRGQPPPLPMGWTKVKRRRGKPTGSSSDEIEWCCDDPSCPRLSTDRSEAASTMNNPNGESYQGQAIFCLHEFGASWYQGYFLPKESKKPWGLLAVEEELDECLECADGGYRRVTITAFPWKRKNVTWKQVEWTGGDMMKLDGGADITMDTKRLLTGAKAIPFVEQYFGTILEKLRNDNGDYSESQSVLELLPNVAVVIGDMSIMLPPEQSDAGFT